MEESFEDCNSINNNLIDINFYQDELKKKINYNETADKIDFIIENNPTENSEIMRSIEIIELDVNRTHFENDEENKRKVIY